MLGILADWYIGRLLPVFLVVFLVVFMSVFSGLY